MKFHIGACAATRCSRCKIEGRCADVETLGGTRPLSLYTLTIARSGERKSACDAPLMAALRAHEREQAKAQREEIERWCNAHGGAS